MSLPYLSMDYIPGWVSPEYSGGSVGGGTPGGGLTRVVWVSPDNLPQNQPQTIGVPIATMPIAGQNTGETIVITSTPITAIPSNLNDLAPLLLLVGAVFLLFRR